jgi:hypothetical protein
VDEKQAIDSIANSNTMITSIKYDTCFSPKKSHDKTDSNGIFTLTNTNTNGNDSFNDTEEEIPDDISNVSSITELSVVSIKPQAPYLHTPYYKIKTNSLPKKIANGLYLTTLNPPSPKDPHLKTDLSTKRDHKRTHRNNATNWSMIDDASNESQDSLTEVSFCITSLHSHSKDAQSHGASLSCASSSTKSFQTSNSVLSALTSSSSVSTVPWVPLNGVCGNISDKSSLYFQREELNYLYNYAPIDNTANIMTIRRQEVVKKSLSKYCQQNKSL